MPKQIRTNFSLAESNCVACGRTDEADNMFQCDLCESWWHFSCAKVTDSISDRSWTCNKCASDGSVSFKSGISGRSGSQLAESMARLKERQELEKRQLELDLQKKFLDEQQMLLDATVEAQTESLKSRVSRHDSLKRVDEWVRCNLEREEGALGGTKPLAASQIQSVPTISRKNDETLSRKCQQSPREHCLQKQKQAEKLLQELQAQLEECKQQLAGLQLSALNANDVEEHEPPLRSLGAIPKTIPTYTGKDIARREHPFGNEQQRYERAHSSTSQQQRDDRSRPGFSVNHQQHGERAHMDHEQQRFERVHYDASKQHRDGRTPIGFSASQQQRDESVRFDIDWGTHEQQRYERMGLDSSASKQQRDSREPPALSSSQRQCNEGVRINFDFDSNGQQRYERARFDSNASKQLMDDRLQTHFGLGDTS